MRKKSHKKGHRKSRTVKLLVCKPARKGARNVFRNASGKRISCQLATKSVLAKIKK